MSLVLFGMEGQEGRVNTVYCHKTAPFCRKGGRLAYAGGNIVLRPAISIAEESPNNTAREESPHHLSLHASAIGGDHAILDWRDKLR